MGQVKERRQQQQQRQRRRGKRNGTISHSSKNRPNTIASSEGGSNGSNDSNGNSSSNNSDTPKLSYKPHKTLLIQLNEETPTWYECGRNTPGRDDTLATTVKEKNAPKVNSRETVRKYRQLADEIYSHEVSLSRSDGGAKDDEDDKWIETTMKRGTLKDRIAAMSIVINRDCVHKLFALDMLLDLAGCASGTNNDYDFGSAPNARVGQMASEALSDAFLHALLPPHRKLVPLEERPLWLYEQGRTLSPRVLLLWRIEEMIRQRYALYLTRYIGRALGGEDESSKKAALGTCSRLLKEVPEGEDVCLAMIVNKIGDPSRKIASSAGHHLRLVLEDHPVMVNVMAREVQQLAHRPHLSPRALYNCIIFLNQLQLSRDDDDDNNNDDNDDDDTQRTNNPKTPKKTSLPASLINTYFHLFEMTVKKEQAQKLKTTNHTTTTTNNASSSTIGMKSRLLSALLTGVNRAHPFLPNKDADMEQHIDALYRIAHTAPPSASTQSLMLLFQLAVGDVGNDSATRDKHGEARRDRFYRALYAKLSNHDMFAGKQITMFFNLLYKAMKYDVSTERICAFAKRLLHTVMHLSPNIVCGALFLLSEVVKSHPEFLSPNDIDSANHVIFDPTKREPRVSFSMEQNANTNANANANTILSRHLWELSLLTHHYHPSVTKFTADCNYGGNQSPYDVQERGIAYQGDPLKDFGLTPFLDKFAFRNPKSHSNLQKRLSRGESIAERKSGLSGNVQLLSALPKNDPRLLNADNIAEEDVFFHRFFVERAKRDEKKGIVRKIATRDDENESDLENEALNAAEGDSVGSYGDTDSEEEEFATQLAEKLMQGAGNGKANFDEEDPDMDDWSDFGDDDVEDIREDGTDLDDTNEDAFMDALSSDDDDDDDESPNNIEIMDNNNDSSEGESFAHAFGDDSEDDHPSLENGPHTPPTKSRQSNKSKRSQGEKASIYADAEEYEQLMEERSKRAKLEDGNDVIDNGNAKNKSRKKKRRKQKC